MASANPKLFSFDSACERRYIDWLSASTDARFRDQYRQLCYTVIDAFLAVQSTGQLGPGQLSAFEEALRCPLELVWSCGGKRLAQCAHLFPQAAHRLETLSRDAQWRVRFSVVCSMLDSPPADLQDHILRRALSDKSARVRAKAQDVIQRLGLDITRI